MTFSQDTKKLATGFVLCVFIVSAAAFVLSAVAHADGPSKEDYAALALAKMNQETLAETREAHELFLKAKVTNETISTQLAKDGWRIDWSNMTLVPNSFQ